ncbi:ATP-dependent (S)-NAD(P)H-hydrate dehydratase isoform X3 [Olea europaea subsp. europaea]|uniref:ATP-dependent (S)-NAD(P)H-hydrate dehydratase isoform X3 n=1 Tax=Olea europaea subsp. europaea TaxID=158383 RepID=A0A8S0PCN7_OLEEU|nr:ATP-dependent (S)-NAD(P)H-hydrate dehydratase isoform X3 [Olea europaea subsp. europaea]
MGGGGFTLEADGADLLHVFCTKDAAPVIKSYSPELIVQESYNVSQDGLFPVTNRLDLVTDYHLAVLTPNVNEYKRLVQKVLNCKVNDLDGTQQLLSLAKGLGGVTIIRKGESDYISKLKKFGGTPSSQSVMKTWPRRETRVLFSPHR